MSDEIKLPSEPWTPNDTENWLTDNPLPQDFKWPHRDPNDDGSPRLQYVLPTYRLHKGYGFWLRTTPYFPGLFEEIHAVLLLLRDDEPMPTPEELGADLHARLKLRGVQLNMFDSPYSHGMD